MVNTGLFASTIGKLLPWADTRNRAGAPAYAYTPKHRLAQLAVTGCLNDTFYAGAEVQLADVLALAGPVDAEFVAKTAVYARERAHMKDMPALLVALLTVKDPDLAVRVFGRVIDNGRMLRSFVQILRSGLVGRKSLGTRPKRLVLQWLEKASERDLMQAATGNDPSLADIVKMVHPKPADAERAAFYGWLIGRPHDAAALPPTVRAFEAWKADRTLALPDVPFQWLTALPLTAQDGALLADRMGWQALRMNLNTLARHGAFGVEGVAERVAARLSDAEAIAKARVFPYQLMAALGTVAPEVPEIVKRALETALELAVANVPALPGRIVVCPDVSGSMSSPVTGYRKGATTSVRCIDVAALVAAAILRKNASARVLPFELTVVDIRLDPAERLSVNAAKLAAILGGGTKCSAPLARLNAERAKVDLVVFVSDNQSWVDATRVGATALLREWEVLKRRCPRAKLVSIDLQPHGTAQAPDRADILNVGGFSDAVFGVVERFLAGPSDPNLWIEEVEQVMV